MIDTATNETGSQTEHWNAISFVISSDYRVLVIEQLANGPEIPSQIDADEHEHVLIEHVSRALRELREQGLVELLVPEHQQKRRRYGLTDRGERVWHRMHTAGLA